MENHFFLQQYLCQYLFLLGTSRKNTLGKKKACCLTVCCFLHSRYITLSLYSCIQASIRNSIFLLCHAKSYPDTVKYRMVCVCHDTHRIHATYLESFLVFKKSHKEICCVDVVPHWLSMHQLLQNPVVIFTKTSSSSLNFSGSFLRQETFVLIDTPNGPTAADGPSGP